MSYYFRERPRFGERFRGKSGDELLQELKQQFGDDMPFFETTSSPSAARGSSPGPNSATAGSTPSGAGRTRDPFERHTSFPRPL
ncbi:hypothetical protein TSAR_013125 [Trichomalopsis sarcophagae]|uniref:Uncharacterized protein n=1 Tax=Trichomalopsis sarcophagae TaxID=543379 RepID=A0A232F1Q7_9HYME|nr:hypothetical protein TSAR_013125 [Trichomalopsis sarcophagae]